VFPNWSDRRRKIDDGRSARPDVDLARFAFETTISMAKYATLQAADSYVGGLQTADHIVGGLERPTAMSAADRNVGSRHICRLDQGRFFAGSTIMR
jgi:hypothetical protein